MKSSSSTPTGTSMITIANATSKVFAFAFCLFSLFGVVNSNSYELTTIGSGDDDWGNYGKCVALSSDAKTMAVGAPSTDTGGLRAAGVVRLYARDGTNWNMFQQINGTLQYGQFGGSLDLSHNSSTLVVQNNEVVYIYDYNDATSEYDSFYNITDMTDTNPVEVCVSGDGSTVGVTSLVNNVGASIFVRDGNGFEQRGDTFDSYGSSFSGIALSYDGKIVAIGDQSWSSWRGRVGVFEWRDIGTTQWVPMGSDIEGDADESRLGSYGCVSITYDGLTVSVGAPSEYRENVTNGVVRVYNHDSTNNTWNKFGSDIVGDNTKSFLSKNAISSTGAYLIVGAHYDSMGKTGGNYIAMYEKDGNNYEIIGDKVTFEGGSSFGWSVDISADGTEYAIGDPYFSPTSVGMAHFLVRNDVTPSFAPTAAVSKTEFALAFLKNKTVIDFAGNSTDKEIVIKSLISDKALRESFEQTIWVGPDCKFKFVEEYPADTTLVTISNNVTLDVVEGKTKEVTSEIDIDTLNIASKGVHENANKSIYSVYEDEDGNEKAKVEFCIRTDYGKVNITTATGVEESSLNFYKVKVAIDFLLEFGFTSSSVTIKEEDASETQQTAVITTNLEACDCPANANSNTDCYGTDAKTYNQNDILSVCVYDPDENSIITSFKDVELGNGQIRTQVIDPDGRPTALASVSRLNEEMAIVNTRIVSAFFDSSDGAAPAPVNVGGTAIIGFKTSGARKLTSVGLKGARNTRKLQDEGEGTFDVEVILSDDEEVDGSPGFDVLEYGIMSFVMTALVPIVLL